MKSRFFLGIATLSLLIAGCENKDFGEAGLLNGNVRIKATMEQKETTRSLVDDSGKFTWATGDEISVFTSASENRKFTLSSGEGTAEGTFDGTLVNDETMSTCAVYPYNAGHGVSGTTLTVTLPAEYGDFTTDYAPNTHAIMVAKIDAAQSQGSLSNLDFKHLGGVLRFVIDNMPVDAAQFVFTATDKDVTGTFGVNLEDTEPVINAGSSVTANNTVTIKFKSLTEATDGMTFYVPLPVGEYKGFSIAVKKQDGTELASFTTAKTNTLSRRTLARIPKLRFTSVGGSLENAEANVSSNSEVESALNNISTSTDPVLDLNASSAVTEFNLPASFTSQSTTCSELNINYSAVPSSITVTENGYSEGTTVSDSKGEVNISIPEATSGSAPAVTIQTPTLTAGLYAAEGETATYGEVTATTANNTLIVGNGVIVNKLTVKGGNVRVKGNAKIETLENSTGGVMYVIKEGAEASVPTGVENVEIVDAAAYDLMMACANGGSYTLTANVTGDFVVSATEEVLINLNGYTVTNKAGDTFTVNNGSSLTISGNGTVDNVTHQRACIYNNGTVVLNGGTYTRSQEASTSVDDANGNSYYNILNHGEMTINAGVTISSTGAFSSLIDNGYYNYTSTNERTGYVNGKGWANPSLKINGGSFSGGINTIKNDDGATLTIENGTFANTTQATVQNNHVATINGGVYSPIDNATYAVQTRYYDGGNNAGQTTISGGTFNGTLYVSGANASLQISGGTFSDPEALQYLGTNANVKVQIDTDKDCRGFVTKDGQTVELDLQGHTLTLTDPTVGSTGTETNSCQLLKGSTVTFKNGTLHSNNTKIVIQNYCTLLLDRMTLETPYSSYSISNNNGSCTLNSTVINNPVGCAFDVYYWPTNGYTDGVTVRVIDSTITGNVEFGGGRASGDTTKKGKLFVEGQSVMNGNLTVTEGFYDEENPNIVIDSSVTFGEGVTGWDTYKSSASN